MNARPVVLSEEEVKKRLEGCADETVVDELYDFGRYLLMEACDRVNKLEVKAGSFTAYSLAIITFLVSTGSSWSGTGNRLFPILAGAAAFGGAISAILALVMKDYTWFSQDEWLRDDCFANIRILKKYRVLAMWAVVNSHRQAAGEKAKCIRASQAALSIAAVFLLLALINMAASEITGRVWDIQHVRP